MAVLVAAPGAYTETHQEYASHYFAAVRVHGDAQFRAHPYPGAAAGAVVWLWSTPSYGAAGASYTLVVGGNRGNIHAQGRLLQTSEEGGLTHARTAQPT